MRFFVSKGKNNWMAACGAHLRWFFLAALTWVQNIAAANAPKPVDTQVEQGKTLGEPHQQALGITAGLISGLGFVYRRYASDESVAHHFGGVAFLDNQTGFFNFGYEYLAYIAQYDKSRLAWVTGVSNFFANDSFERWNLFSVGSGIALENGEKRGISVVFELPLSFSADYTKVRAQSAATEETKDGVKFKLQPIPSLMLIYRF